MIFSGRIHVGTLSILTCIGLILLSGCRGNGKQQSCNEKDWDIPLFTPIYASGFSILGLEGNESVMLRVYRPWQGADSMGQNLLILRGGEKVPDGYSGQVINNDAKRIVAMSSTHVAMLDALGESGRIAGVSGRDFISTPSIKKRGTEVADVGYDGNIDYETLVGIDPDIVLLYGVAGASSMENKLNELNIPWVYIGDHVEEHPLGKAEWMVALGEIIGKREKAFEIYNGLPQRYNELAGMVDSMDTSRPMVMLNMPYSGSWFMPSADSYMVRLIEDAGGRYAYPANTTGKSIPVDMETAYTMVRDADVWINVGTASNLGQVTDALPRLKDAPCVTSKKVYNNNLRSTPAGGNDFFESGIVHPDIVLRDLIKIFHTGLVEEDFEYYRRME